MRLNGKRVLWVLPAILLVVSLLSTFLPFPNAYAANITQITTRSLTLQTGTDGPDADTLPDGGSQPGGVVNHQFDFTIPQNTNGTIHSIEFQYCTTPDVNIGGACTTPLGLDTTSAALGTVSPSIDGLVAGNGSAPGGNGTPYVTSTSGIDPNVAGGVTLTVQLTGVTNPNNQNCGANVDNCTFFVRITAYTGNDGVTGAADAGTVTAATSTQIVLTGTMPESLIFCTGGTIDVNASNIPQCSTATSGAVTFNQLFSPESTTWATSQMAASTNAEGGYAITVHGPTLTSGSNTIAAIGATAAASSTGTGQFGMNVVDNSGDATIGTGSDNPISYYTDPEGHTGGNVYPAANGTNYRGQPKANFDTASSYAFSGNGSNVVAASDNTAAGPTDSQRFTSTYVVNVSGSQPAGTYTTTLTYICTPTF